MAYTVDQVSDLLGVPRPTLYRYLREYSIPHLRRAGKIYVPEESFDRIKEVRELHKEGLGTESVRRRLRGESNPDTEELTERLDRISETLENLQGNLVNGVPPAKALQTILARQSVLISAVSDLTEMLEDVLPPNGRRRKVALGDLEEEIQEQKNSFEQLEGQPETTENDPVANEPVIEDPSGSEGSPTAPIQRKRFGIMAKRRRHVALAILLALLASTALVVYAALGDEEGSGASQEEPSAPSQQETAPIDPEEALARDTDAATSDSESGGEETPEIYTEQGYGDPTSEQPLYEVQEVTPELPPQEQPVLQPELGNPEVIEPPSNDVGVAPGLP